MTNKKLYMALPVGGVYFLHLNAFKTVDENFA